ncbi:MAG TPA: tetratricopeptide repeat protein [Vicinamibacterales bacterium]|jgi:tetratricopeptide (TPR) repeat protein
MAKQRRPSPQSTKAQLQDSSAHPPGNRAGAEETQTPAMTNEPRQRATYVQAVALYERGVEALQNHAYQQATTLFESVLQQYPEEKELHERVRLYLNICQRQAAQREAAPQTIDERLYAATLAINGGSYDQAIAHLRLVRDEDPDNDHAIYMLAVAHAQRGEHAEAVAHLERAIALNPENRALARHDPDLEPLRADAAIRTAMDTPSARIDPRRSLKTRSAR